MEDEEDDLYGTGPVENGSNEAPAFDAAQDADVTMKQEDGENEDSDDDGDDSESDIDIITERKDEPAPQSQTFKRVKQEPVRITSAESVPTLNRRQSQTVPAKSETPATSKKVSIRDGSKYPEFRSSTIDVDAMPTYDPAGKLITEVDLDADIAAETKPWRIPGTDPTDFFNYGFDEFTWVQYCLKQNQMRETVGGLKNETKQFEAMLNGPQPGMAGPPGMDGMPPEMMNAMFSFMQSTGATDPSQMDFGAFMQHMGPNMGAPSGPGGGFGQNGQQGGQGFGAGGFGGQAMQQQGSGQGFGNQSPFAGQQGSQGYGGGTPQPQQQPQSFDGYSQQQIAMMQQGGGGGQQGGRGRGRRGRW